jgi:ABC-2 type transport system permease protein
VTAVQAPAAGAAYTIDAVPARAVTGLAVRQIRRGALIVAATVAGMSALVVATYRSAVADGTDIASLTALATNPAVRTLFGEPVALDDPGGFTVWRTGTVLAVLLSVYGLLTATRITRGEEDAGRWDLLLAGRLPAASVLNRHVVVAAAATAVGGAAATGALLAAGTDPVAAALHGAGLALAGVFAVGTGALAAQVFATRSAATGAAVALLAVGCCYAWSATA